MMALSKRLPFLFIGLLILWALLLYYPVRTGLTRTSLLLTCAALLLGATALLWKHRWLRWLPAALPTAVALFLLLPGRPADPAALQSQYVRTLRSYAGTPYVWGGENWRGVDCSGLLRSAMVDAQFKQSLLIANPVLARQALWLWWHDANAYDMGQGYAGLTRQLAPATRLRDTATLPLSPGDFAVTADGSHVLAYLGDNHWIDADPYDMRVEEVAPGSSWWGIKVIPCRWRSLTETKAVP